ncbi:hypothetical protein FIA58_000505 [Flavobacterium jejuense]|uniref:Uncharacterized protein n=1 Tax=Flavobacterium jejuense TaxID=1544455 RepID=A0ABX0IKA5_9FLAO|nr:hypothetical protein [Flavobacterium jejuense]NHN24143.1 hypothetical protein [Flavobacterium jejuense]
MKQTAALMPGIIGLGAIFVQVNEVININIRFFNFSNTTFQIQALLWQIP